MNTSNNTIDVRQARVESAIALKEPDRIPFVPKISMGYNVMSDTNAYEVMVDGRNFENGVRKFLERYEIDMFRAPSTYPLNVFEILETDYINWPGPSCGLGRNSGIQILDKTFLEEDEYDEFLLDPSHFFTTKIFPRKHKNLCGLSKISFNNLYEHGHYVAMQSFTDPEFKDAMFALMAAGEEVKKWMATRIKLAEIALSLNTPLDNMSAQCAPYDMFADNIRGYINVPMDLIIMPEKVQKAIDLMEFYAVESIEGMSKNMNINACYIPLHGGTDELMSNETYKKYYWPSLLRIINLLISKNITPHIFCEGRYDTRLEILKEVPKGKVVYQFEKVDMARVKQVLGDTACICGNIPGALLLHGTVEDVVEETKKLIDICGDGGGFIMDSSMALDDFDIRLMDAWYETTLKYGVY